ncbi:hypothetical protein GYMLUDRAFT_798605 [Collybiopsis luxurians FD-317 M1]|nr:hypothetical protein GYMLUDRAFT_798605 [Collybiopsis luxurians FD-317 M1]
MHRSRAAIIGGIIGGIGFLILLVVIFCLLLRRRRRSRSAALYSNLDRDTPRSSTASTDDIEAPSSPLFNPMAMVVTPSSHSSNSGRTTVSRKPVPFYDILEDENATIKRTATFSRRSRTSDSLFSEESTRYSSSFASSLSASDRTSTASYLTASDRSSIASTVKPSHAGASNPFADPGDPMVDPMADNPFADPVSIPSLLPRPPKPLTDENARVSRVSAGSSHWGVAM